MQSFFKSALISAAAVATLAFASSASATCVSGCVPNTPPPPPAVTPVDFGVQVGGNAGASGFGGAQFDGTHGGALVSKKIGYAGVDTVLDAAGNLCGLNCQSGSFTFNGYAGEHVKAEAVAGSNVPGTAATAANQVGVSSFVNFQFKKMPVLPAAPAPAQ